MKYLSIVWIYLHITPLIQWTTRWIMFGYTLIRNRNMAPPKCMDQAMMLSRRKTNLVPKESTAYQTSAIMEVI